MTNDPAGLNEQYELLDQKINELVKKCRDLKYKNAALEEIQSTIAQEKALTKSHRRRHPIRPKLNKELESH